MHIQIKKFENVWSNLQFNSLSFLHTQNRLQPDQELQNEAHQIRRVQQENHLRWPKLCVRDRRSFLSLEHSNERINLISRDHIQELKNAVPDKPLIFLKPSTAYVTQGDPIKVSFHHWMIQPK